MQAIVNADRVFRTEQTLSSKKSSKDASSPSFKKILSGVNKQDGEQGNNLSVASNAGGYTRLWNSIAVENPELLSSNASLVNCREARAAEIKNKLVSAGVGLTTATIIANREAGTVVRRPDNIVPGPGASGYYSMPESIRSEAVGGNPQVREGIGYAYIDRYGFPHVVTDLATALNFSGDGKVYEYEGRFGGGYPLDKEDSRSILDLPQARIYSNAKRIAEAEAAKKGKEAEPKLPGPPAGEVRPSPLTKEYIKSFAQNARLAVDRYLADSGGFKTFSF